VRARRLHVWRIASYGRYACERCGVLRWEVIDSHTKAKRLLYADGKFWSLERPECLDRGVPPMLKVRP
jgi:hypothetical protein